MFVLVGVISSIILRLGEGRGEPTRQHRSYYSCDFVNPLLN